MVKAARPQSWGVARLSFGMPKNVGQAPLHPKNLATLPSGGNPLPMVADCEKPNWKINNQVKNRNDE